VVRLDRAHPADPRGLLPHALDQGDARGALGTMLLVFLVAAGFGDTMTDITANAVGGLAGGVWLAAWSRHA
jgi:hypothetical protein